VRQVRLGLRRTPGTAPRRLARPLTLEEIRRIVAGIDRTTPIEARDAAIILIGFALADPIAVASFYADDPAGGTTALCLHLGTQGGPENRPR
jgi:hypothetical protein